MTDTKKFSPGTPRPFLSCLQRHILPISDTEMDSKAEYFKSPMRDKSSTEFQFPDGNEHCNHLNANTCFLKHLLRCIVRYNILLRNPRATSPLSTIRHPAHRQEWAPQLHSPPPSLLWRTFRVVGQGKQTDARSSNPGTKHRDAVGVSAEKANVLADPP